MRKYNDELIAQLVEEKWHTKDVRVPVYEETRSPFGMPYNIVYRQFVDPKEPLDYIKLAEELVAGMNHQLNNALTRTTHTLSLFGRTDGTSSLYKGKIITPNKYVIANFKGADNGRFWKGVYATIRVRIIANFRMSSFVANPSAHTYFL